MLFPVWCWSQNCLFGVKHPEVEVNTQPHIALWTFKSYPHLFCVEHTQHHICLPFWGQWTPFCTLSWLVEGVGLPCGVVLGWDCALSVHYVSVSVTSFTLSLSWGYVFVIKYPVPFKGIPKMSCTQNTTVRNLCRKYACLWQSNAYNKLCLVF
jgi:hypothetical protein